MGDQVLAVVADRLPAPLGVGHVGGQALVLQRLAADLVSLGRKLSELRPTHVVGVRRSVRARVDVSAADEEGRVEAVVRERGPRVQKLAYGAVVERQRDDGLAACRAGEHARERGENRE